MKIKKKDHYSLVIPTTDNFESFTANFTAKNDHFLEENIVISFLESFQPNTEQINSFLAIASKKKEQGTSFVLVIANISVDDFPEVLNISPTITEAEDIIEMENIERELGF